VLPRFILLCKCTYIGVFVMGFIPNSHPRIPRGTYILLHYYHQTLSSALYHYFSIGDVNVVVVRKNRGLVFKVSIFGHRRVLYINDVLSLYPEMCKFMRTQVTWVSMNSWAFLCYNVLFESSSLSCRESNGYCWNNKLTMFSNYIFLPALPKYLGVWFYVKYVYWCIR